MKLGMMKEFVKALDRNSPCFQYLHTKFSSLSHAKIREGIFDGLQIRKLMMDDSFTDTMTETEERIQRNWQHQRPSIQRSCKKSDGQD
jgi:hypothetical protein